MACSPAMMMTRLTTRARTGRRMKRSVIFMVSVVLRFGRFPEGRSETVVDHDRLAVAQLEDTRADDGLPLLQAVGDGDEVAALLPEPHELLPHRRAPVALSGFPQHEHGVAERGVEDGRGGNG